MPARNSLAYRVMWVIIGNIFLSLGQSIHRLSGFGTSPFVCMNLGVSSHLPISMGTLSMLVNICLFIPVFMYDKRVLGIGAVINMLLFGYMIDAWMFIFSNFGVTIESCAGNMPFRVSAIFIGTIISCWGVAVYMECNLGSGPWDKLAAVIESITKGKVKFGWARVAYDCAAIAIGFFTGAVVGPCTLVMGFFTGPLVDAFKKMAVKYIF